MYKARQATGEEGERHVLQLSRAKLYAFHDGGWQERGQGTLVLNERLAGPASSRLVMRLDKSQRLVLNAPVWPGLRPERLTDKTVRITAVNHALSDVGPAAASTPQIFLIKVTAKECVQLLDTLQDHVAHCDKPSSSFSPAASSSSSSSSFAAPQSAPAHAADASDKRNTTHTSAPPPSSSSSSSFPAAITTTTTPTTTTTATAATAHDDGAASSASSALPSAPPSIPTTPVHRAAHVHASPSGGSGKAGSGDEEEEDEEEEDES